MCPEVEMHDVLLYEASVNLMTTDVAEAPRHRHGREGIETGEVLLLRHLDVIGVVPDLHVIGVHRAERVAVASLDRSEQSVGEFIHRIHDPNLHTLLEPMSRPRRCSCARPRCHDLEVLVAGLLALGAAVLHASWNFIAKRSVDPFVSLWGLSIVAGAISAVVLAVGYTAGAGPASASWLSAAATGAVHIVYLSLLGRAFAEGDFSLAYPIARGGGALVAGLGGIVLLGDRPTLLTIAAFLVTLGGMTLLAWGARRRQVLMALTIAGAIGTYTTIDSHAVRETDSALYVFAVYAAIAVALSMWGVARGRVNDLASLLRTDLRIVTLAAVLSLSAYGLVLVAVTRAPVGYVAAIRETSVLIAVLLGWKVLGESHGRTRVVGAITVCAGLSSLFLVAA